MWEPLVQTTLGSKLNEATIHFRIKPLKKHQPATTNDLFVSEITENIKSKVAYNKQTWQHCLMELKHTHKEPQYLGGETGGYTDS